MTEQTKPAAGDPADLPLAGLRIVDFSRLLPGPWCTQTLADMGADVIKIEQPDIGDYSRFNPPTYEEVGAYFNAVNRNKRSIALDLTQDDDYALARRLIAGADVVVESFRAGVTENLKIDYATVSADHPELIYCSVTGLGNPSAMGRVPGHDLSVQAVAGALGKNLKDGEVPPMPPFQAGDFTAAIYAAIGILGAHIRRQKTGRGCYLEAPMYDSLICSSNVAMTGPLARAAGYAGTPEMETWGANPRYSLYMTKDGKSAAVCLLEMRAWHKFCRHIGREDLIYDEDWEHRHTPHGDLADEFRQAIAGFCMSRSRDDLAEEMKAAGISITPVYTPDEALHSPHAQERGMLRVVDHPTGGKVAYLVDPLIRAGLADPERRPSPRLGEHDEEIRREISGGGED